MMPSKLNGSIQRKVKISGLAKMIIVFYPFVLFFHTIYYFQSFPIEKKEVPLSVPIGILQSALWRFICHHTAKEDQNQ
jgi:hypothetical protein